MKNSRKIKGGHVEAHDDRNIREYEILYDFLVKIIEDIIFLMPVEIEIINKSIQIIEKEKKLLEGNISVEKEFKHLTLREDYYNKKKQVCESKIKKYSDDLNNLKANFWNDLHFRSRDKAGEEIEKLNKSNSKIEKAKKILIEFKIGYDSIYNELLKDYEKLAASGNVDFEIELLTETSNLTNEINDLMLKFENNKESIINLKETKNEHRRIEINPYERDLCYNYPCRSKYKKDVTATIDPIYGTIKYSDETVEAPIKKIDKYRFLYADGKLLSTYGQVHGLNYDKILESKSPTNDNKKYPTFKWAAVNPKYNPSGWKEEIAKKIFYGGNKTTYFLFPDNTGSGEKIEVVIKIENGRRYFESVRPKSPLYMLGTFYDNSYLEKSQKAITFIQREEYVIYQNAYNDYNKAFKPKVFLNEVKLFSELYTYPINGGSTYNKVILDKVGRKELKKTKMSTKKQRKTRKNKQ